MDSTVIFFAVLILIFFLAYAAARYARKWGSDRGNVADGGDFSAVDSEQHGTAHHHGGEHHSSDPGSGHHGGDFGGGDFGGGHH